MTTLIILFLVFLAAEKIWSPRLEYIKESEILILHYNVKNSRKYLILWKNQE